MPKKQLSTTDIAKDKYFDSLRILSSTIENAGIDFSLYVNVERNLQSWLRERQRQDFKEISEMSQKLSRMI